MTVIKQIKSVEVDSRILKRIQIEESLNTITLNKCGAGILCGPLLNKILITHEKYESGFKKIISEIGWIIKSLFKKTNKNYDATQILLINTGKTERLEVMFNGMNEMLTGAAPVIFIGDIMNPVLKRDVYHWFRSLPKYLKQLKQVDSELSSTKLFKKKEIFTLKVEIFFNVLKEIIFLRVLNRIKPQTLLIDYDRNRFGMIITQTANLMNISTYTMVHGVPYPPSKYVPFIANTCFCWGTSQKELFEAYLSEKSTKYLESGNPRFKEYNATKRNKIVNKLGLNPKFINIMLASERYTYSNSEENAIKIAEQILEALSKCNIKNEVNLLIKLHPIQRQDLFDGIKSKESYFTLPKSYSLEDSIIAADIIIVTKSAIIVEALVNNKIVIVFNPLNIDIGVSKYVLNHPLVYVAKDINELVSFFNQLTQEQFVNRIDLTNIQSFLAYKGNQSTAFICKELNASLRY